MPENENPPPRQRTETITLSRKSRLLSRVVPRLRGTAQWTALMRNFSQSHVETCKSVITDIPQIERPKKTFTTGSSYEGSWNQLGISGEGTYTFPRRGVVYKGGFLDGECHGDGELQYADGTIMKGKWNNGDLVEKRLYFADGLEFAEKNWAYCRSYDRRYTIENNKGLQPAGRPYMTAEQPTIQIPPDHYDVGSGFYDPVTKTVYEYGDLTSIARAANEEEQEWIKANCRVNPDDAKGPCPFLYEDWPKPDLDMPVAPRPHTEYGAMDNFDDFEELERILEQHSRAHLYDSRTALGLFYDPTKAQRKSELGFRYSIAKPHRDFIAFSKEVDSSRADIRSISDAGRWGLGDQPFSKKASIFVPRGSTASRQSRSASVAKWGFAGSSPGTSQARPSVYKWGQPYSRKSEDFGGGTQSRPESVQKVGIVGPSFLQKINRGGPSF